MKHCWCVLLASVLAVLRLTSSVSYVMRRIIELVVVLPLQARLGPFCGQSAYVLSLLVCFSPDGEDCLQIMQHKSDRNVPVGGSVKINCTYRYMNCSNPSYVSWYKLESNIFVPVTNDSRTNVKSVHVSNSDTMLLLSFTNIQVSNAGFYRCQSGLTLGQNIKVSVYDNHVTTNISLRNETPMTADVRWMYAYSAVGTMAFVIVVVCISVISMQRCKGNSERETQSDNQQPASAETSSGSFMSSRMTSKEEKPSERRTEKDASSVVYTALHHQLPAGAPVPPRRPKEESSEYADIRV
ncbi:uncharacterized protein LOC133477533 isoform X2 [Phyllopteryx taeniolatus]|uniref:uncharacterized protein LOC133477533 isoform X2 n=1 Tax=Phyllopteryx taeniolatus TaxID=161469 RepID=UPI002AD43DB2|nr:uncharacterized protein LOC133477533 isoform X2 [Phyllopteryx taeniolatus]